MGGIMGFDLLGVFIGGAVGGLKIASGPGEGDSLPILPNSFMDLTSLLDPTKASQTPATSHILH